MEVEVKGVNASIEEGKSFTKNQKKRRGKKHRAQFKKTKNNQNQTEKKEENAATGKNNNKSRKRRLMKTEENGVDKGGMSQKKNMSTQENDPELQEPSAKTQKPTFDWKEAIVRILKGENGKPLNLKKLRKQVLEEYESKSGGSSCAHTAVTMFNKQILGIPGILTGINGVKLISET